MNTNHETMVQPTKLVGRVEAHVPPLFIFSQFKVQHGTCTGEEKSK